MLELGQGVGWVGQARTTPANAGRREAGRLLVEVVVATGIAAVVLMGVAAIFPLALRARDVAAEKGLARRACEQRLIHILAMDESSFRGWLAGGGGAGLLAFAVDGLKPAPGAAFVGAVAIRPPPGSSAFDAATLFEVEAGCRWQGADGETALRIVSLYNPRAGGGPEGGR